jgi:hypothetical protein
MPTFDVRGEVEPWAGASSTRERLLSNRMEQKATCLRLYYKNDKSNLD